MTYIPDLQLPIALHPGLIAHELTRRYLVAYIAKVPDCNQPALYGEASKPWHKRGRLWIGVMRTVSGVGLPPALISPGKPQLQGVPKPKPITVNGEVRGDDWGKGDTERDFAALRIEYEKIPRGKRVEYEILSQLGLWRKSA